jgi:hypothetical protein
MNRRTGLIILVIALLSVVLATWYLLDSFASPPSHIYGFLQDDPCILPCWENITPDESSELDTLKTVIKRGLISGNFVSYPKDDWLYFFTQTDAACDDFNRASRLATGNVMAYTPVTILSFVNVAATSEGMLESFDLSETEKQKITTNMVDWSGYGFYSP